MMELALFCVAGAGLAHVRAMALVGKLRRGGWPWATV